MVICRTTIWRLGHRIGEVFSGIIIYVPPPGSPYYTAKGTFKITDTQTGESHTVVLPEDQGEANWGPYINSLDELPIFATGWSRGSFYFKAKLPGHDYVIEVLDGNLSISIEPSTKRCIYLNGADTSTREKPVSPEYTHACIANFSYTHAGCEANSFYANGVKVAEITGPFSSQAEFAARCRANEDFCRYFSLPTDDFLEVNQPGPVDQTWYVYLQCPRGASRYMYFGNPMLTSIIKCFNNNKIYKIDVLYGYSYDLSGAAHEQYAKFNVLLNYVDGSITWPSNWVWLDSPPELITGTEYYIEAENIGGTTLANIKYSRTLPSA